MCQLALARVCPCAWLRDYSGDAASAAGVGVAVLRVDEVGLLCMGAC